LIKKSQSINTNSATIENDVMEPALEVLKILANLAVFLISVTIGTYSVAVSFLGPKYARAANAITREKEKLEKELKKKMTSEPMKLEELEKRIDGFRKKEKRMKRRFGPLSLLNTVLLPSIFFGLSLLYTLLGIYMFTESDLLVTYGPILLFVAIGLIFLGRALFMIQRAARETAITLEEIGKESDEV
jgi:hypothetical protein